MMRHQVGSIMAEFGLPFRFSKKIEKSADEISDLITREEIKKRRNFRDVTTFTTKKHDTAKESHRNLVDRLYYMLAHRVGGGDKNMKLIGDYGYND